MERAEAVRKLGKLLGKSLGYRVDPKAPTPEEREQVRIDAHKLHGHYETAKKAMDDRRRAILEGDQEYVSLVAKCAEIRKAKDKAFSLSHHYKIQVGVSNSMFFHIKAEGDSWEQVIEKLERPKVSA